MTSIIFATNNQNKVDEIRKSIDNSISICTLTEAGIDIDIPEPHDTLEENALEKAVTIQRLTNQNCFSEDTGLEVAALDNEPGVKSARYAGEEADSEKNIKKLLQNLGGNTNRKAQFRTIICLIYNKETYYFEGICKGNILYSKKGNSGFGYDAIFVPDGSSKSFGEMDINEKNQFSHRKKAVQKLINFLKSIETK